MLQGIFIAALAGISIYALGTLVLGDARERRRRAILASWRAQEAGHVPVREQLKDLVQIIAQVLQLERWLGFAPLREKLARAGRRGPQAEAQFLFVRLVTGVGALVFSALYVFLVLPDGLPFSLAVLVITFFTYIGIKLPEIQLDRAGRERIASIKAAWPDALDLALILVEAGKPVEQALRRMADDIARSSAPLSEEISITLAELSFLPERRQAYENLGNRTDLSEVRSACMAIIQSEQQGTSLAPALRALSAESRAARISAAEQQGAKIAAILSLPVMIFFMPPLVVISAIPALISYMGWK
ncbi:type II secretion system F family protein [Xanthobacter sp. TB0139]|uniref:type II secretion system F family protein n=1 Tax=Xanthobacter sp. TB0139 TaxID=3459178 RepID=UPI00403A17C5